jgi:hypothetical protein
MNRSSLVFLVCFLLPFGVSAADATSAVDATRRNAPFAPSATGTQPESRRPDQAEAVQRKRVSFPTVETPRAVVGDRRAAIEMSEAEEKRVREKQILPRETVEPPKSVFDQQRAPLTTREHTTKPAHVAKYQDSLVAASAANMARFPAASTTATGKINRFVFRKNGGELAGSGANATAVPAAGGSRLSK